MRKLLFLRAVRHVIESLESRVLLAQVPAFPGAEGYGMFTSGGRGGAIYEVTNLNDSGAGSLRDAVSQPNRTIVFRVSGTINLASTLLIDQPNITIAGQTAPGGGITLKNFALRINDVNVIVRYIRVRPGDTGTDNQVDGISMGPAGGKQLIFDHVSTSWGIDENFSIYGLPNVTIQWSVISEALHNSKHPSGAHSMGGIMNGWDTSLHHNIFISNNDRNPKFNIADWWPGQNTDFRNNVVYNWGTRSTWGGNGGSTLTNVVNNYYKAGPSSSSPSTLLTLETGNPGEWHVGGNYVNGFPAVTADNWTGVANSANGIRVNQPFTFAPVTTQSPQDAYASVLANAGATVPLRDSVDTRVLNDVVNGTGAIINTQTTVGGWPTLPSSTPPTDTDHDGMPDSCETSNGLNPNDASDRNGDFTGDGYTNVEKYLNSLVPTLDSLPGAIVPSQAFWPYPANGATQQDSGQQLKWKAGFNTVSERIYFGTTPNLTEANFKVEKPYSANVSNKQLITNSNYDPGPLVNGTTHYWRIDGINANGTTTGQTWSFTPGPPVAGPGAGNRMEAENMTLSRAFVENSGTASNAKQVSVPSETGTMRYAFNKPSGLYRVDVRHIDEGDGAGLFSVYVNSDLAGQWTANVNNDQFVTRTFNNVLLNPGDVIKVVSNRHQDELGRVDYVDTVFQSADTVAPTVATSAFQFQTGQSIAVQFSEGMNSATISPADLQVQRLSNGAIVNPTSVSYNVGTKTATFSFATPLPDGNYAATLAAGSVSDPSNNSLAAPHVRSFFVLVGDANRDRHVDDVDQAILTSHLNQPGAFGDGDFDYSGTVNAADQAILDANSRHWLPEPGAIAVLPATAANDAYTIKSELPALVAVYIGSSAAGAPAFRIHSGPGAASSIHFDGGAGADTLAIVGTAGVDVATFNASSVNFGALVPATHANVESVTFDGAGAFDDVTINAGATVAFTTTQRLSSLNLVGSATLDMGSNDLMLDYDVASPLAVIQSLIHNARSGGTWTGSGITSSAARDNPQHNTTLAAMEAADFDAIYGSGVLFDGIDPDSTAVLVKYTYYGDANFNGTVNFDDYVRIDVGFNTGLTGWFNGDFNYSGAVNFDDYILTDVAFNTQGSPLSREPRWPGRSPRAPRLR